MGRTAKPQSVKALEELGRRQLSPSFFMRDFLFSDIAAIHGLSNVPDNPDLAVETGSMLCTQLLEPLQERFGRIAIRSAYRSCTVNAFGNERGYKCANNEKNFAGHIWDVPNATGKGAMACIVVPSFANHFKAEGDWKKLAWWIHDHLPYSTMEFFPSLFAFNLGWHESPVRSVYSHIPGSQGYLTRPGFDNYVGLHEAEWAGLFD
ncbi:MAG: hypothetical protein ABI673_11225 [Novosphingobium sp.]